MRVYAFSHKQNSYFLWEPSFSKSFTLKL